MDKGVDSDMEKSGTLIISLLEKATFMDTVGSARDVTYVNNCNKYTKKLDI